MDSPPPAPKTIHYSQVPRFPQGHPLAQSLDTYLREVPRLLAEGHEGKHILIKDDQVLGLFDTHVAALAEGYRRFRQPRVPFLVQQILTYEPIVTVPFYRWSWPTSR
jgi:hypothetical protein